MLRLLTGAVALSLAAGCGSNVAGTISRAEAFGDCNSFSVLGWGAPLTQDVFDTMLIVAEALRDSGDSRADFLLYAFDPCAEPGYSPAAASQCAVCMTSIAAVVWP